jgi:hypothetical protein
MIPAYFGLSQQVLDSDFQSIHATLAFAIIPPAYEWLIMGGGLTRAPGTLFSILALTQFIAALKTGKRLHLGLAILFTALTGYCHIEILWITTVYMATAVLILARNRQGFYRLSLTGLGAGVLLTPYVLAVLRWHGLSPFLSALQAGDFNWAGSVGKLLISSLTQEALITPVLVFAFLGLGLSLQRRYYLLPAWILVSIIFDPRSLERTITIPLCMLAGLAIDQIILPGLADLFDSDDSHPKSYNRATIFPTAIGAALVIFMLSRTAVISTLFRIANANTLNSLSQTDRQPMLWVADHTPPDSQFLVLTPYPDWKPD